MLLQLPDAVWVLAIVLFAIAIVLVVRRFTWGSRSPGSPDWVIDVAKALLWDVFFILLLPLMCLVAGIFGFFLWLASIVIAAMIAARYRQAERRAFVWSLTTAAEKSIPMSAAVRAYASERRGGFARRARRLADALDQGKPLDAALQESRIRLPDDALVALQLGLKTGALHESLRAAARNSANIDIAMQSVLGQLAYLSTVLLVVGGALAFLILKIMPTFYKIFADFHHRLPQIGLLATSYPNVAVYVCELAAVVWVIAAARYSGLVRWDPPLLRAFWRQLDQAIVLRSLALAVDRQGGLPGTLALLADQYPKRYIRRRCTGPPRASLPAPIGAMHSAPPDCCKPPMPPCFAPRSASAIWRGR